MIMVVITDENLYFPRIFFKPSHSYFQLHHHCHTLIYKVNHKKSITVQIISYHKSILLQGL